MKVHRNFLKIFRFYNESNRIILLLDIFDICKTKEEGGEKKKVQFFPLAKRITFPSNY